MTAEEQNDGEEHMTCVSRTWRSFLLRGRLGREEDTRETGLCPSLLLPKVIACLCFFVSLHVSGGMGKEDMTKNSAKLKNMGALGIDRDLMNHKAPQILYSLKMKHL